MSGLDHQHELILILTKDLTSRLATPAFVVDAEGSLVYFNEAAEPVLGRTYAEAGELKAEEWGSGWHQRHVDGRPISLEENPLTIAFREGRPAHLPMRIRGGEGHDIDIEVAAFPLVASPDRVLGALAIFWERHDEERP